jgi:hypothetical protein
MGVKGTQFFAGHHGGTTNVAVLDGTVWATPYIPPQQQPGNIGSTPPNIVLIHANQMAQFGGAQSPGEIQPEPLSFESLDLFALEAILESGDLDDELLEENIRQLIEQRRAEEQQQQQQQQQDPDNDEQDNGEGAGQQIYYDGGSYSPPTPPTTVPLIPTTPITPPAPGPDTLGNETTVITYPTAGTTVNTKNSFAITGTATDQDNDLISVKVSVKNLQTGMYLDGTSGSFTSEAPVYQTVPVTAGHWSVSLNGSPFTGDNEFGCMITAIAYDGEVGTPVVRSFHVDNQSPQLLCGQIPYELPASTQEAVNNSFSISFHEELTADAKANVVTAIQNAIIEGALSEEDYTWAHDMEDNSYNLTVTNPSIEASVYFDDVTDVSAVVSDLNGNSGTVRLLQVDPVTVSVDPESEYLEIEELQYVSHRNCFTITLPQGCTFVPDLVEFEVANLIKLGGVLDEYSAVRMENIEGSGNQANLYVYSMETPYTLDSQGIGIITLSQTLLNGNAPCRVTVNFTAIVDDLQVDSFVEGQATLSWTPLSSSTGEIITVYQADMSAPENYYVVSGSAITVNADAGTAVIYGLTPGATYYFKLSVNGGMRPGESNSVCITMPTQVLYVEDLLNVTLDITYNNYATQIITVEPDTEDISITLENSNVYTSLSYNEIYITGITPGSTVVTVIVRKEGFLSVRKQFTVTVNESYIDPDGGC